MKAQAAVKRLNADIKAMHTAQEFRALPRQHGNAAESMAVGQTLSTTVQRLVSLGAFLDDAIVLWDRGDVKALENHVLADPLRFSDEQVQRQIDRIDARWAKAQNVVTKGPARLQYPEAGAAALRLVRDEEGDG